MPEESEVFIAMSLTRARELFITLADAGHAGVREQLLTKEETLDLLTTAAELLALIEVAEKGGGADPRMN